MNSREQFESFYCEVHQIPLETFSQYRMGESYREPMIAKCWRFWKASREAMGSSVADPSCNIELMLDGKAFPRDCAVHGYPCGDEKGNKS